MVLPRDHSKHFQEVCQRLETAFTDIRDSMLRRVTPPNLSEAVVSLGDCFQRRSRR